MFKRLRWAQCEPWLVGVLVLIFAPLWFLCFYSGFAENFFHSIPYGWARAPQNAPFYVGGDHSQIYYYAWKLKQAVLHGQYSVFADGWNFANPQHLFYDFSSGIQYWLIFFSSLVLGDIAGYNFGLILLPFTLGMIGAYFLAMEACSQRWISLLFAILFTIHPYRISQAAGGHASGSVLFVVPFYLWALLVHRRKTNRSEKSFWDFFAGAILILLPFSEEHTAYYLLLYSPFFLGIWLLQDQSLQGGSFPKRLRSFVWQWKGLLFGALSTVGLGQLVHWFVLQSGTDGTSQRMARSFYEIQVYSKPINDYFWVTIREQIGIYALALATFVLGPMALRARWKQGSSTRERIRKVAQSPLFPWVVVMPFMFLMMFGIGTHWSQRSGFYQWAYRHLPYFKYQRISGKMFTFAFCAFHFLVLGLWADVREQFKATSLRKQRLWTGVIAVTMALQIGTLVHWIQVEAPDIALTQMDRFPGDVVDTIRKTVPLTRQDIVLSLPLSNGMDRSWTFVGYLATLTERRYYGGYQGSTPAWFEDTWPAMYRLSQGEAKSDEVASTLTKAGIRWILVDEKEGPQLKSLEQKWGAGLVEPAGPLVSNYRLYRMRAPQN